MSGPDPSKALSESQPTPRVELPDEPPPFLGTWTNVYIALLTLLAVYIALFFWITEVWH